MDNEIIWIIIGIVLLSSIFSQVSQLRNDIKRTNCVLEKIAKQIGVPAPHIDDEIKTLIAEGKRIKAIKKYREISGVGLKEAKDYIDKLI